MLASTTHDTKRSEDVRARIALLSEIPEAWAEAVEALGGAQRAAQNGRRLPDRNLEYLLYQTHARRLADRRRAAGRLPDEGVP